MMPSFQEWLMITANFLFWQAAPLRMVVIYCLSIMGITLLKLIFKF